MAQLELVGWRAREAGKSGCWSSPCTMCEVVQPTRGMTSPDEITVLGSLTCCMSSCLSLSCGFALSECILGQSSYGSLLAMSGEKKLSDFVVLALSYAGHGLTSFSSYLPSLEILLHTV